MAAGLALAVAGLFFRLDASPVVRSAEERCFDAARHMLETGNWLVPVRGGQVRLQKPPLYYWAAAAIGSPSGELSRFALRAPAALSALGLLAVVFFWGRAIGGFGSGALAATALLMMDQFWSMGRRGVAEMPLALFCAFALLCFDRVRWEGRRAAQPLFFLSLFLAFMAKATVALLVVGLPILGWLAWERSLRQLLQPSVMLGAVACLAAGLSWYVAMLVWVPEAPAILEEALLLPVGMAESTGAASHVRPFWFHLEKLLAAAAPAIYFAPFFLVGAPARRCFLEVPRARFPLFAFGVLLLGFSLIPMKQKHYLLPLLPPLAVASGHAVHVTFQRDGRRVARRLRWPGTALWLLGPALALLLLLHLRIAGEGPAWLANALAAGLLAIVLFTGAAGRGAHPRSFVVGALLLSALVTAAVRTSFDPWRDRFDSGALADVSDLEAARWARLFDEHPLLRRVYQADELRLSEIGPPPPGSDR